MVGTGPVDSGVSLWLLVLLPSNDIRAWLTPQLPGANILLLVLQIVS